MERERSTTCRMCGDEKHIDHFEYCDKCDGRKDEKPTEQTCSIGQHINSYKSRSKRRALSRAQIKAKRKRGRK